MIPWWTTAPYESLLGFSGLQFLSQQVNWVKIELQTKIYVTFFINEKLLIQKLNTTIIKQVFSYVLCQLPN